MPGVCSPSRSVVSKKYALSGRVSESRISSIICETLILLFFSIFFTFFNLFVFYIPLRREEIEEREFIVIIKVSLMLTIKRDKIA
jgi:hypothetical protein